MASQINTKVRINKSNHQCNISIPAAIYKLLGWEHGNTLIITPGEKQSLNLKKIND